MRSETGAAAGAAAAAMAALTRYPEAIAEISARDQMYNSAPEPRLFGYTVLGRSALDCIRIAMLSAQKETVSSVLDLPSGHGRVLRYLKAEFPEARLVACDIDHDGVDYCARTFGAEPLYGRVGPPEQPSDQVDLIWCGSLLTHLDEPQWLEFLEFFEAALVPGGLLVFTTHGRSVAAALRDPERRSFYLPSEEGVGQILRDYELKGFGYAEYPLDERVRTALSMPPSFGISAARLSWVCALIERRPGLQLVTLLENRWGAHDVVGCVRVDAVEDRKTPLRLCYGPEPDADATPRIHHELEARIRPVVESMVPVGETMLVVSRGDEMLIDFPGREGRHFLEEDGTYAGRHPADSAEAIAQLERQRERGARYLVIPEDDAWWLEHYAEFARHLGERYEVLTEPGGPCMVFRL